MNNFIEELKKYFDATPQKRILEDWAKSADFDNVEPTVDEFLSSSKQNCIFSTDPIEQSQQNTIYNFRPEFSSGFF